MKRIKTRIIEEVQVDGDIKYIIQVLKTFFWLSWWIDVKGYTGYYYYEPYRVIRFDTIKQATDHICHVDGSEIIRRVIE